MKNYFTKKDEELKWKSGESKILLSTVVCKVTSRHKISAQGIEGDYITMEAPDWVIVVPEIDGSFYMVKQWRQSSDCLSIEFPGGVIDKGESPLEAAKRELEEETGCRAKEIVKIGELNPNPALFNNRVHFYYASALEETGKQHLDSDEFISCLKLSKEEVLEGIGTKQFPHAMMTTAFLFYLRYTKQISLNK